MKVIRIFILTLLPLVLSSCVSSRGLVPYGKWQSVDPILTLDINPESDRFLGIYEKDGKSIDVYVIFSSIRDELWIYGISDRERRSSNDNEYFDGLFKLKDGKLHVQLRTYSWQIEQTDYEAIVFEKIEDCDYEDESPYPIDILRQSIYGLISAIVLLLALILTLVFRMRRKRRR